MRGWLLSNQVKRLLALNPQIERLWFAASAPSASLRIVSEGPICPKLTRSLRRAVGRARIGGPLETVTVDREGNFS